MIPFFTSTSRNLDMGWRDRILPGTRNAMSQLIGRRTDVQVHPLIRVRFDVYAGKHCAEVELLTSSGNFLISRLVIAWGGDSNWAWTRVEAQSDQETRHIAKIDGPFVAAFPEAGIATLPPELAEMIYDIERCVSDYILMHYGRA